MMRKLIESYMGPILLVAGTIIVLLARLAYSDSEAYNYILIAGLISLGLGVLFFLQKWLEKKVKD